jgi:pimeloyl-ACP methyl ester carboxylesterase
MTVHADIQHPILDLAEGVEYLRRAGSDHAIQLVLLHGVGSNAKSFEPLMAALPMSVDCIAWNAPGYGRSHALAPVAPIPRDYADALLRLLDLLALPRVVLLGHSLGCLFAASFAAAYPDRVAALALLSPALGYRVAPGSKLPPVVQGRIDDMEALGPKTFAAKRAGRLVHDPTRKAQVVAAVEHAMAAVHPAGYIQAVRALAAGDLLADAAHIQVPALVAVGAEDVITPLERARAAHAALPRAVGFHAVASSGHALPQEQPEHVADLLVRFIAEHTNV